MKNKERLIELKISEISEKKEKIHNRDRKEAKILTRKLFLNSEHCLNYG